MMPGLTGYEVTQQLRETHPAALLPIVLLTARSRPSMAISRLSQNRGWRWKAGFPPAIQWPNWPCVG